MGIVLLSGPACHPADRTGLGSATGSCDRSITQTSLGQKRDVYPEIILDDRMLDFDPCSSAIPQDHYGWIVANDARHLTVNLWGADGKLLPVTSVEWVMLFGGTVDSGRVFHPLVPHLAGTGGKLLALVNGQFYSNFLYLGIYDAQKQWTVSSTGGVYDFGPPPGTAEDWSIRGTITLTDTGGVITDQTCTSSNVPCVPRVPIRTFSGTVSGTICQHQSGPCAPAQYSGTATVDTIGRVNVCLGAGNQFASCYLTATNLTFVSGTLSGTIHEASCAGKQSGSFINCVSGPAFATRRP